MKDYVNYLKFTWTYYASALLVALVFVIENNIFTIKDLAVEVTDKDAIANLSYVFADKVNGANMISLYTIGIAIFVMLLVRHLSYADNRKLEFLYTLPVKNKVFYVVDYVMHCLILFAVAVVDYVMYMFVQQQHNNTILQSNPSLMADNQIAKQVFSNSALHYFLIVFVVYNVLYLGLTVGKNAVLGMVFSGILLFLCWYYLEVWGIGSVTSFGKMMENIMNGQSYALLLAIVNICVIVGIMLVIQFRRLHKGNLCYFSVFEYGALLLIAMLIGTLIMNYIGGLLPIVVGVAIFVILVVILKRKGYRR